MANENENVVDETKVENDDNLDYIETIKNLKQNTVTKDEYNKLKAENKKLLSSIINGETVDIEKEKSIDINDLRKELFGNENEFTNLEYVSKVLELRNAVIEKGNRDPFLPYGHNIAPTAQDVEAANRVANILQECVDYAEGDSGLFTAELQRRMIDAAPIRKK